MTPSRARWCFLATARLIQNETYSISPTHSYSLIYKIVENEIHLLAIAAPPWVLERPKHLKKPTSRSHHFFPRNTLHATDAQIVRTAIEFLVGQETLFHFQNMEEFIE